MAKREKNWQADIYDLATAQQTVAVDELDGSEEDDEYDEYEADLDIEAEPVAVEPLVQGSKKGAVQPVTITVRRQEQHSNGDIVVLGGMIAGAVVGALFGLFIAPDRGEETRKKLSTAARQQLEEGKSRAEGLAQDATTKVSVALPGAKKSAAKAAIIDEQSETILVTEESVRVVPATNSDKVEPPSAGATISTASG